MMINRFSFVEIVFKLILEIILKQNYIFAVIKQGTLACINQDLLILSEIRM